MALDTDLSRKPYFDDYVVTKNFYRILYRPAAAVQARELNQMQTIMQDQIGKFGRYVFKEGSVVEGCAFTFDNAYNYVKIGDNYANNFAISNINDFVGKIAINSNGLKARVVNALGGYESENPNLNTLYVKYINSSTYSNGVQQTAFSNSEVIQIQTDSAVNIGNTIVATVTNSTGQGYAFTTTEGVIFKKGFFIRVEPQTLVVTRYNNVPDGISVGFEADEQIITPEIDTSLLDNAAGSPNYDAPGAHRLKLVPNLITRSSSDIANSTSFFSVCDFKNGLPVSIKNDPQLAVLGKQLAQRTYETNGDYVVNPFLLTVDNRYTDGVANTNYLNLVSSAGVGYVKGSRVEFINNNTIPLRKGTDYETVVNQIISSNFGYYFNVTEYCGDFNNDQIAQIDLHREAKYAIRDRGFLSTGITTATKIGTAYCRGVAYSSGIPGADAVYRLYIFNINMLSGYRIADVRSAVYKTGSTLAIADIVLTYDAASSSNIAVIQDSANELMIHPFGQKALKLDGFSSSQYVYRNKVSPQTFQTNGAVTVSISAPGESFLYTGQYSPTAETTFIVVPTTNGYSTYKTGNVTVTNSSVTVTGTTGTLFSSEYIVGDYIYTTNGIGRISAIANNTSMTLASIFDGATAGSPIQHQKIWPAGVPINFVNAPSRTISATTSTATLSLNESTNGTFNSSFYFDVLRSGTDSAGAKPIKKVINKNSYVKIKVSNNVGGTTGPWCLGIPDVLKINHVYVGNGTYSSNTTTNPDLVSNFVLDNGQRDSFYNLAYISSKTPISNNATLLISLDNFTFDTSGGVGFFTANSYPIDDANTANTTAIQTYQIPTYTTTSGTLIDLRDSVDFRPYAVNTAIANASYSDVSSLNPNPANTLTLYSYSINGSYLPSPDSNYQSTIQHYLPRQDRVALTTSGEILITEGISSNIPTLPVEVPGTMTIGAVSMTPYPSLKPADASNINRYDYAVQTVIQQTKRYTMADIGKISGRIDRLEYYTSLSLLEQSASSLLVRSNATGQNRFKNGILVDPFKDHNIGNTLDSNYRIAIDSNRGEARPFFKNYGVTMVFDSAASTAVKVGEIVLLPYTSVVEQQQVYASKYRNCIEGNIYNYRGSVTLDPPAAITPDLTVNPDIVSNLDQSSNWINVANYISTAWGTQWGAWTNVGQAAYVSQDSQTYQTGQATNPDGSISQSYQTQTTTTLSQQQQQVGQQITTTPSTTTIALGDFVTNVSILPYVKAMNVLFTASGMKPGTKLYAYFNGIPVLNRCIPVIPYSGSVSTVGGIVVSSNNKPVWKDSAGKYYEFVSGNWGASITADSSGNVYGIFSIPDSTFKSGDLEFKLTDISNLTQGESAVTTQATTMFLASQLSVQKSSAKLQVRSATINTQEVVQNRTIQQNTVQYTDFTQYIPAPYVDPGPVDYGWYSYGSADGGSGGAE